MRIKITIDMMHNNHTNVSMDELNSVMRAAMVCIVERYRGKVDNIMDSYSGNNPDWYGYFSKVKEIMIVDEEKKVDE